MIQDGYDFLEVLGSLPPLEERLLLFCYKNGRFTFEQLLKVQNEKSDIILQAINNLLSLKLLQEYKFQSMKFYELNIQGVPSSMCERFPSGPIIPLVYQFNLLSDRLRMEGFRKAIEQIVEPGHVVLDLGCGTGIMSLIAAKRGGMVFAVEADPSVAEAAEYFIKSNSLDSKISLIVEDSRNLDLDIEVDIIICEMIDTGLIAELQVEVMNDAVKKWLKPGGRVIPHKAYTSAEIINMDYSFLDMDFRLIHFEEYGAKKSFQTMSSPFVYHTVDFTDDNSLEVSTNFSLKANTKSVANGLKIRTRTLLAGTIELRSSPWYNPPLILPFGDIPMNTGDELTVDLSYGLGAGFSSINYNATLMR